MNSNRSSFRPNTVHEASAAVNGRRPRIAAGLAAAALLWLAPTLPWADHHGGTAPTKDQITAALSGDPAAVNRVLYHTALTHSELSAEQQLQAAKQLAAVDSTTPARTVATAALHAEASNAPKNGWTDLLIRASASDTALADELAWLAMLSDHHRPAALSALASRDLDAWLPQVSPALRVGLGEAAIRAAGDADSASAGAGTHRSRLQTFAKTALDGLPPEQTGHLLAQMDGGGANSGAASSPSATTQATTTPPTTTTSSSSSSSASASTAAAAAAGDPLDSPELIAKGKVLFQTKTCFTCHTVDPTKPAVAGIAFGAPAFTGKFWGEELKVRKGTITGPIETVVFDQEYFIESIKQPMLKITDGAKSPMIFAFPTSDDEITALAAYVKSLSE